MSELSVLKDDLLAGKFSDAGAEVQTMMATLRGYLTAPIADILETTAVNKIESLRASLVTLVNAYLVGKLGPEFGALAENVADSMINIVLNSIEGVLTGAATAPQTAAS